MKTTEHEIRLSDEEAKLLRATIPEDNKHWSRVIASQVKWGDGVRMQLSREVAEAVRECLTMELAKVGFEEDYSLTREGRLLESMIDKLFVVE